jgi:hypothetical protein
MCLIRSAKTAISVGVLCIADHNLTSINFVFSSQAIRKRFGKAIKTKTLGAEFKGVSITNKTTHSTRIRVAILKVYLESSKYCLFLTIG